MLSFDFILIKYLISGLQLLSWMQRKYQLLIIVPYITHTYDHVCVYISLPRLQEHADSLSLWGGEKCASDVITVLISIETMLSSFYYLYKIKILCFGCLFSFHLCLANNLNEDWLVNNFFKTERLLLCFPVSHTYTLGSFLPWSARKKPCIPSCYESVNLKRRCHMNRKALYRTKSMGCY